MFRQFAGGFRSTAFDVPRAGAEGTGRRCFFFGSSAPHLLSSPSSSRMQNSNAVSTEGYTRIKVCREMYELIGTVDSSTPSTRLQTPNCFSMIKQLDALETERSWEWICQDLCFAGKRMARCTALAHICGDLIWEVIDCHGGSDMQ